MGGMIDTLIANIAHKIFAFTVLKFDIEAWLRLNFSYSKSHDITMYATLNEMKHKKIP